MQNKKKAIAYIISKIFDGERNLDRLKRITADKFNLAQVIRNPEILQAIPSSSLSPEIHGLLLKKPTKTLSGVTPIAVMIRPEKSCKYGCIYCPAITLAAKSYTGFEPAALRGRQYQFDSFLQTHNRLKQFSEGGHPTDKCEIIVMGGTFLETELSYRRAFIKGIYDALNEKKMGEPEESIKANEKGRHRAIGLTIETRPDVCIDHIDEMLGYGATRVELGVQHADDAIYSLIKRGHTVKDVIDSTKELKNTAFKVLYHIMPGLPGSSMKKDISFVKKLFSDPHFKPDMLKIYPTLVVSGAALEKWAKDGSYKPYSSEEAAEVISEFYRYIPKYVRVMRIQRDIPAWKIESGVKKSNLRELVESKIREKGIVPKEIRYREIGLQKTKLSISQFRLVRLDYSASAGKEIFLSSENHDGLIAGFIRLRILGDLALIRELHVYGSEVPLEGSGQIQHRGLGLNLLKEAQAIAKKEFACSEIKIISGVGVREYYRKHGYSLVGHYMWKKL